MSSHFDLVDFRLFAHIAEASSFTAGAEASNLSTSAASLRIRHLEDSLGGKLFHRTNQGSSLTPAGEACLERVHNILREFDNLKADVLRLSENEAPGLRVAVNSAAVNEPLPDVMREYSRINPGVKLILSVMTSNEIVPAVSSGAADIGIGGSGRTGAVDMLPYLQDRLVLLVSRDHPLSHLDSIRFAEALDYEIVSYPPLAAAQNFMLRIAQNSRKPMVSSVTVSSYEALVQMVAAGIGIGVISRRVAYAYAGQHRIKVLELKDKSAVSDIQICVASLRNLPQNARQFVDLLQRRAEADGAGGEGALP